MISCKLVFHNTGVFFTIVGLPNHIASEIVDMAENRRDKGNVSMSGPLVWLTIEKEGELQVPVIFVVWEARLNITRRAHITRIQEKQFMQAMLYYWQRDSYWE